MSDFSHEQIKAFRHLAQKYDKELFNILSNAGWSSITIKNDEQAAVFDEFSNKVCRQVLQDYPDYEGKHADINADAEMVTFMIADVLADYRASNEKTEAEEKPGSQNN